ncbi:MAG: purine-nucleoside phosphorylase [Gemmatimonadota bacterium]
MASVLREELEGSPEVLVVLGSGLAGVADILRDAIEVPFGRLPGFPEAGVLGHPGRFVGGTLGGRRILAQLGRFHLYEGHGRRLVEAPILAARALGAGLVVLTNSSGSIAPGLEPGQIALIEDHLDLQSPFGCCSPVEHGISGRNSRVPTRLRCGESGSREIEMVPPPVGGLFDPGLAEAAQSTARDMGIQLTPAVYAAVLGPNYETPAEIRMLRAAGADLVGMSTVPEAKAARRAGMRTLGLSVVANRAAGLGRGRLDHEEVLRAGEVGGKVLSRLLEQVLARLDGNRP